MLDADAVIAGGLTDPVLGSQSVFRALMDALAHPGTAIGLPCDLAAPAPIAPELAAILLTLADHDTPIWLDARLRNHAMVVDWIGFQTGAPLVADPAAATFAFADAAQVLPAFADFAQGSDEYPDRSATLVLAIEALSGGGDVLTLRGPGIAGQLRIAPKGLPPRFIAQWHINRAAFPRGVDVLLVASGKVMGLPRTTRIATEPV